MGTVLVAYDPELDRRVALKLLRHDSHDPEGDLRLLREARALAKLSHPHVVPVYDVGEHGGAVYMAMELVEGQTLRAWLAAPRTWREVLAVLASAGRGLEAAHAAGVVHRDFKPSNVMIGSEGRVRVVDFGLARASATPVVSSEEMAALDVDLTGGSVMGTLHYMAPEQHEGRPLDARADVFSFCVTLHEALWGARPFEGATYTEVRGAIGEHRIVRPAGVRLPGKLRRLVDRGLADAPADRFDSMSELLDALESVRRRRGRLLQVTSLAFALVAGAAASGSMLGATDPPPASEVLRLATAARDAAAEILFVYPPPEEPKRSTAFAHVLELESLDLPGADEEAQRLRSEFAATLDRVGDEYWSREGGLAFAMDYYAQALVFDPDDAHARARTSMTLGELAALREKATTREFSTAELEAGEILAALAQPEGQARERAVASVRDREKRPRALTTQVHLEALAGPAAPHPGPAPAPEPPSPSEPAVVDAPPPEPIVAPTEPAKPSAGERSPAGGTSAPATEPAKSPTRDPVAAASLVAEAKAALARREHAEAERLLHRAAEADPRSDAAVALLSDVCFDRGRYDEAVRWAKRATKLAPKSAAHLMRLGDALFKVLRYAEAREAYSKAETLGSAAAAARLRQIDEKLGAH